MAETTLNDVQFDTRQEQVGRIAVPQGMNAVGLGDLGLLLCVGVDVRCSAT